MNLEIIITGIITSGLVVSIFSLLTLRRTKNLEFNYDYRKDILNKRKEAYEKLEIIFYQHGSAKHTLNRIKYSTLDAEDLENLRDHWLTVSDVSKWDMWFSEEMSQKLAAHEALSYKVYKNRELESNPEADAEVVKNIDFFQDLIEYTASFNELFEVYFRDIVNLDKIDSFTKERIESRKHELQKFKEKRQKNSKTS